MTGVTHMKKKLFCSFNSFLRVKKGPKTKSLTTMTYSERNHQKGETYVKR